MTSSHTVHVRRFRSATWGLCSILLTVGFAQADPIGTATEAQNDVSGKLGDEVRVISPGSSVSTNEAVRTGTNSSALLEFLDRSKLNVGASSTVVLDQFIYDPNSGTDEVVLKVTKGALRFIGSGSGKTNVIIKTPSALMGIRG